MTGRQPERERERGPRARAAGAGHRSWGAGREQATERIPRNEMTVPAPTLRSDPFQAVHRL